MIKGKNITKIYNSDVILDKLDFTLSNGKKVGLVGRNGCGKTTLFKVISGAEEFNEGDILKEAETISYIPQEFNFPKGTMVGEYFESLLDESWEIYKVDTLLSQLEFSNYDEYQLIETMSEGQKMKIKMAEELLKEPTTLIIDEPTNHLDIEGILWFENYIKRLKIQVLMISHDRSFLNNTVDEIWEIEDGKLIEFKGDYDNYKYEKEVLINKQNEEYKQFLDKKRQLEKVLESARKIKDGKKRGKAVSSTKKRIERLEEENTKEAYESKVIKNVSFNTDIHNGKLVIKIEEGVKSYGKNQVFSDLKLDFRGQERIWIKGKNGTGKSTLVKIITEDFRKSDSIIGEFKEGETLTSGAIFTGNNLKVGYFAQKLTSLDKEETLYKEFIKKLGVMNGDEAISESDIYGTLEKFLFTKEDIKYKRVKDLSPGQRARFAFAIFSKQDYDVLILDEPTNHLDIETKEVIEQSLKKFKGTLILVSHDRYFVDKVGIDREFNLG